jgi:ABC-type branched-subunit amino acid transport system substrate-binding protein
MDTKAFPITVGRHVVLTMLTGALLVGCASSRSKESKPQRFPDYSRQESETPAQAAALPWEIWQAFHDLSGQRLSHKDLLLGDELLLQGKRRSALDAYLKASAEPLLPREVEAAALRVGSQYLALDKPEKSLSTVSAYFKKKGLNESQVQLPFSLLLAYAYGRKNDIDQALAWFSRAYTQAKTRGVGAEAARQGVAQLLRTINQGAFESLAVNWRNDEFINEQIGRERQRRASSSYDPDEYNPAVPFWKAFGELAMVGKPEVQPGESPVHAESPVIGVILSLSEKFGSLGRETRQGFELAVLADTQEPKPRVEARDVGADTAAASAAVRELVVGSKASVIVGPLLTEAATAAAQTARELQTPLLSFSKSESFRTGEGIFRLGATTTSQIDALIQAAYTDYKLSRFAVVYPQTALGTEYVQAFRKKLGTLGLPLVLELSYVSGDESSMLQAAQQLESSSADAVLIPDNIEVSSRLLANLSPATRKRIRPLGTALWDNPVKIANSQALFERGIFVTAFFPQSTRRVVQQFSESYKSKYRVAPTFLAAQGFDVGTIVVSALRRAQRDGRSFSEALSQLPPYDGVTGYISFEPPAEIQRRLYVVEVTNSDFMERLPSTGTPVIGVP